MFDRVLIVGLGLLGGSFALALREAGLAKQIFGTDANPEHEREALALGLVSALWERQGPAKPFDLIFVAVPPSQVASVFAELGAWVHPATLVTDACSVKAPVASAMQAALGNHAGLLPAHPIAGWHTSGPSAGRRDLFPGRPVILTPLACTSPATRSLARQLWVALGAHTVEMEANAHDALLALISHLPHLLAYSTVNLAVDAGADLSLAGPGFRDATRLAQCPADLWADIALANRAEVLPILEAFIDELRHLKEAIHSEDRECLTRRLARAQQARASLSDG
jgi:prephenate dehydrogenase